MRRTILTILGVLLLLAGIVFASQGAGVVGGSGFMDNNPTWINYGAVVAVLGVVLIALGALWKSKPKAPVAS